MAENRLSSLTSVKEATRLDIVADLELKRLWTKNASVKSYEFENQVLNHPSPKEAQRRHEFGTEKMMNGNTPPREEVWR